MKKLVTILCSVLLMVTSLTVRVAGEEKPIESKEEIIETLEEIKEEPIEEVVEQEEVVEEEPQQEEVFEKEEIQEITTVQNNEPKNSTKKFENESLLQPVGGSDFTVTMEDWYVGEGSKAPNLENTPGGTKSTTIEYKKDGGSYSESVPTEKGSYYVRVNAKKQNGSDNGSAETSFKILEKISNVPTTAGSKTFNNQLQTSDIIAGTGYTVKTNAGGTNAGEYDVVLSLDSNNYYAWNDGTTEDKTIKFSISKATNEFTVSPSINGWTYGGQANDPSATAKFGEVTYTYYDSSKTALGDKPSAVGDYYFKAYVTGNDNYTGLESDYISFSINGSGVTNVNVPENAGEKEYNGQLQVSDLTSCNAYTVTTNEGGTDAGTYTVTLTINSNYKWNDALSGDTRDIEFKITPKKVDVPSTINETWTGNPISSGLSGKSEYSSDIDTKTDVGNYTATLTINKNYAWNDALSGDTREVTFNINRHDDEIKNLSIEDWTYGEEANTPSATSFSEREVKFSYSTSETGEYTDTVPEDAGTYYVKGYVEQNKNYNAAYSTKSFTISKADNEIEWKIDETWYIGETQNDPICTVKNGTPEITYYSVKSNGQKDKLDAQPTTAIDKGKYDHYEVVVVVDASDNYNKLEKSKSFKITEKELYETPENLSIDSDGNITWTKVDDAKYKYSYDNTTYNDVPSGGLNCKGYLDTDATSVTVYVKRVSTGNKDTHADSKAASCTKSIYTLTLVTGTGIKTVTGAGKYFDGTTVDIDAEVNVGYTWSKWNDTLTDKQAQYVVNSNTSLTASAIANTYTIKYDKNDELATGTMDDHNLNITNQLDACKFVKAGYKFGGWTIGDSLTVYDDQENLSSIINENNENETEFTLKAKWVKNTYTFTFNNNGGSGTMEAQQVDYSVSAKLKENEFYKVGNRFVGWSLTSDGEKLCDDEAGLVDIVSKLPTTEVTLYAMWETSSTYKVKLDVIFDGNEPTYTRSLYATYDAKMPSFNVEANNLIWPAPYTKDNKTYKFMGYYLMPESTPTTQYYDRFGESVTNWNINYDNVVLKGWYGEYYTITYVLNATDAVNNKDNLDSYLHDPKFSLDKDITLLDPTRTGYEFVGWYSDASLADQYKVTKIDKGSTGNKTFYAKWKAINYTITYKYNNGQLASGVTNKATYTIEDEVIVHNPIKRCYTFLGWSRTDTIEAGAANLNTVINKGETGNREFTAVYSINNAVVSNGYKPTEKSSTPYINPDNEGQYIFEISIPNNYNPDAKNIDGVTDKFPLVVTIGSTTLSKGTDYTTTYKIEEDPQIQSKLKIVISDSVLIGNNTPSDAVVRIEFKKTSTEQQNENNQQRNVSASLTENTSTSVNTLNNTLNNCVNIANPVKKQQVVNEIKNTIDLNKVDTQNVSESLTKEKLDDLLENVDTDNKDVIVDIIVQVDITDAEVEDDEQGNPELTGLEFKLTPKAYVTEDGVTTKENVEVKNSDLIDDSKFLIVLPVGDIIPETLLHISDDPQYEPEYIYEGDLDQGGFVYDSTAKTVTFYISHFSKIQINTVITKSVDENVIEKESKSGYKMVITGIDEIPFKQKQD